MGLRIVTLGDSIAWGQGLLDDQKYDTLVRDALGPPGEVSLESVAHSGAVIGANPPVKGDPAPGEVPAARLTMIEQCDGFTNSPETVDVVLMNGGINDVGVSTILNPLALLPSLKLRTRIACHLGMLTLLKKVSAKFSKPSCRIVVTGYYAILSDKSEPLGIPRLLGLHGIAVPAFIEEEDDFFAPVIRRCEEFFADSTAQLTLAVADAQDPRITFVPSGFTDENAVFVPGTSFLFGLDADSLPEDPVAAIRRGECNSAHSDPTQFLEREVCYRASAGHPNPAGAQQFKKQILAVLGIEGDGSDHPASGSRAGAGDFLERPRSKRAMGS